VEQPDGTLGVVLQDCGDWVFDPHQGSCTWPEQGDELC